MSTTPHALGGQAGFEAWLVNEMIRSLGTQGLSRDLHIFSPHWLDQLLEAPRLHAELKKRLEKAHHAHRCPAHMPAHQV